jgi:thioredoxin reductase (NADPH)
MVTGVTGMESDDRRAELPRIGTVTNSVYESRREQMFPKLSDAQMARLESYGQRITTQAGEVLVEPGDHHRRLVAVVTGSLDILLPARQGESLLVPLLPGDFAGELSTLRGVSGFVRVRVRQAGEIISIEEDRLRDLIQTDAELSEIMMRAFILRRMALIAAESNSVMLLGSSHSAATLQLVKFLTRNNYPFVNIDVDTDARVQSLLDRFHVSVGEIPVLIACSGKVMRNPSIAEVALELDMNPQFDDAKVRDVIVVGAGPAGLSAAVYAASEGLDVLVIEATAPGGQAGTSSRIENYLGFPTGISGQALAGRAFVQSQKFGASLSIARHAVRLHCDRRPYAVELSDGHTIQAHNVIIATGAQYRELDVTNLHRFVGAGVYYAATHLEAKLCKGETVIVIGGGNSAGQAAVFLAGSCRHVHVMVRADGLAESMSRYLIHRIEENPNITLHVRTQLTALEGEQRLERVRWSTQSEAPVEHDIGHVFAMTGAVPNTGWLANCVVMDDKGFVRTGPDIHVEDLTNAHWPLARSPHLLETSLPGIYAVGDARSGNVKRIASAVGEGAICVQFVHRTLHESAGRPA